MHVIPKAFTGFTDHPGTFGVNMYATFDFTNNLNNCGQTFFKDFDVWARSGGFAKAHVETVPVQVTDGKLKITFTPNVENPQICAIEIVPGAGAGGGAAAAAETGVTGTWQATFDTQTFAT